MKGWRGDVQSLPQWARLILSIAALPAILLAGLSVLLFLVSILALLLLVLPVYGLLRRVSGSVAKSAAGSEAVAPEAADLSHRRQVEARVINIENGGPADES